MSRADARAMHSKQRHLEVTSEATVVLLLEKGADVNAQGRRRNALQIASSTGHEAIAALLLEKGMKEDKHRMKSLVTNVD